MKAFLEEYGLIIVVIAVILILLLMGTSVGEAIRTNVMTAIGNLFDKANTLEPDITNPGAILTIL